MAATISAEIIRIDDPLDFTERAAIAGFLAGYTGDTLVSYTNDLRLMRSAEPTSRSARRSGPVRDRVIRIDFNVGTKEEGRPRRDRRDCDHDC